MTPTTSLLDRASLDRDAVRHQIARGLEGADDGELFLEYRQSEALMFDNGRLKQATYDTCAGLRPARGEGRRGRLCAFLRRLAAGADSRRGCGRAVRGGYPGTFAAAPGHTNVRLYGDDNPLDARLRIQGQAARRN